MSLVWDSSTFCAYALVYMQKVLVPMSNDITASNVVKYTLCQTTLPIGMSFDFLKQGSIYFNERCWRKV